MEIERQHKMVSAVLAFVLGIFFIYAFGINMRTIQLEWDFH